MLSNLNNNNSNSTPRKGCMDMWNAEFLSNASYTEGNDIPICFQCNGNIPVDLISYDDALALHKKLIKKDKNYHINKYVHFYIDDQKFDGKEKSIWLHIKELIELLRHFDGIISPDFSTNADFPDPVKRNNIYRMRAIDYICQNNNIPVIHNVRWGTDETWSYCFDGIPLNGIIAIGTVASGINKIQNRPYFESGFLKTIELLKPHTIIIYGSANYEIFIKAREAGINIISFPSKTSLAFAKEVPHE